MEKKDKNNFLKQNLIVILTIVASVAGSYFLYKTDSQKNIIQAESNDMQNIRNFMEMQITVNTELKNDIIILKKQLKEEKEKNTELSKQLLKALAEKLEYSLKLETKIDESKLLNNVIQSFPFPAWCKEFIKEENKFIMRIINGEYTALYGKTAKEYIGFTDYDVHSFEIAALFEKNDFTVLNSNKPIIALENIRIKNKIIRILVYKFLVNTEELNKAVCGVSLDLDEIDKVKKSYE